MATSDWNRLWARGLHNYNRMDRQRQASSRSTYVRWISQLLEGANLAGGASIELGCGTGLISRGLFDVLGLASAVLVDFSAEAVALARVNAADRNIRVVQTNVLDYPAIEKFDLCLSVGLVEHFQGDMLARVVRKHAELLKPAGHAVILAPRRGPVWPVLRVFNRLQGIREEPVRDQELVHLCGQNGLAVRRKSHYLLGMVVGIAAVRR